MKTHIELLYNSALEFLEPLSLKETYKRITEEGCKIFSADYGTVLIESNNKLVRVYSSSPSISATNVRTKGRTYKTLKSKQPYVSIIKNKGDISQTNLFDMGIKSIIFIPLEYKKKTIGVLNLLSFYNNTLSQEISTMTKLFSSLATLAIMKSQSYEDSLNSIKSRDLFIAIASHELKTPLTTISAYLHAIKQKVLSRKLPDIKWLDISLSEFERLKNLINELLQVDTIKKRKFIYHRQKINLIKLIETSMMNINILYPQHRIILQNNLPKNKDIIFADPEKLSQVFINILSNSAKFSPSTHPIFITVNKKNNTNFQIVMGLSTNVRSFPVY